MKSLSHYRAFGLAITSDRPIPGLPQVNASTRSDLTISLDSWPDLAPLLSCEDVRACAMDEDGDPLLRVRAMQGQKCLWLRYADRTEFALDRVGTRIWARWPPSLTLEDVATYLLGPIFSSVLRLRGITCLHGSAMAIAGRAVLLLGTAGAGKSTTAAAFARLGYAILSDDVVPLKETDDGAAVEPAYPRIRLWPASVKALFGAVDALPTLTPNWEKRYLALDGDKYRFQLDALPLGAIYVLDTRRGDPAAPSLRTISPREALIALVGNTHGSRSPWVKPETDFRRLAHLITKAPVKRVVPHADIALLNSLCNLIREDAEQTFGSNNDNANASGIGPILAQ